MSKRPTPTNYFRHNYQAADFYKSGGVRLPPADRTRSPVSSHLVLTAIAILACLYFGREVSIPFALAVLISFLLSQPVSWLERLRLGRKGTTQANEARAHASL